MRKLNGKYSIKSGFIKGPLGFVIFVGLSSILLILSLSTFAEGLISHDENYLNQIRNEIKLVEKTFVGFETDNYSDKGESVSVERLTKAAQDNKLYNVNGLIEDIRLINDDEYVKVSKSHIDTDLEGVFYANKDGKVHYEDVESNTNPKPKENNSSKRFNNNMLIYRLLLF